MLAPKIGILTQLSSLNLYVRSMAFPSIPLQVWPLLITSSISPFICFDLGDERAMFGWIAHNIIIHWFWLGASGYLLRINTWAFRENNFWNITALLLLIAATLPCCYSPQILWEYIKARKTWPFVPNIFIAHHAVTEIWSQDSHRCTSPVTNSHTFSLRGNWTHTGMLTGL